MHYGVILPNVDILTLADLARTAEAAGWDGVFIWDTLFGTDAWIALATIATQTTRIRFGTMLTPLSRRRPWKVANEVVTLDHLSNGRVVLPVGLGATGPDHPNSEFHKVGEETDRKIRARMLDESLDILDGLWSGQPFSYDGDYFHIHDVTYSYTPVQTPRVPIWVVGAWPRPQSMRRVLRCDGVLPVKMNADRSFATLLPDDIRELKAYVEKRRTLTTPFDIVVGDETPGDDPVRAAEIVRPWAEAGATWWLEDVWRTPETEGGVAGMDMRVRQGPPRGG
jgi:alkanesulfonate monooxygenase SsuD/methylene tetrahydromethanopterin reductase-like flavin-dependent oxidoreductase (luciferase family)